MAAPLIDTQDIVDSLANSLDEDWAIPIYTDFPNDRDVVRFGLYVSDVSQVSRTPYQLGVTFGGGTYSTIDEFEIVYVTFQEDPHKTAINAIISDLVTVNSVATGEPLMNGYYERNYDQSLEYTVSQGEKNVWTFRMSRLEFQ